MPIKFLGLRGGGILGFFWGGGGGVPIYYHGLEDFSED